MKQNSTIERMMREALLHHQAGHFIEAAQLYEQVLKLDSSHADSLHLLGMVAYQAQRPDLAIDLIQRAIAANSRSAAYHSNLGTIFQSQGKLDDAEAQYTQALRLNPDLAETLGNLGSVLLVQGKLNQAIICYERAIVIKPNIAELHFHLGNAFRSHNKLNDAVICYERALALKSNYAEAHSNLGSVLLVHNSFDLAVTHFKSALAINSNLAEARNGLGCVLYAQDKYALAIEQYERALALQPNYAEAHSNYGTLLESLGKLEEAIERHKLALSIHPDYPEAHNSLGNALGSLGQLDKAIEHFNRALTLKPDLTEAYYNLGIAQLCSGDFVSGWPNYEWRWQAEKSPLRKRKFSQPQWHGEPLNGARILIHAEQGLGDTLQFLRYLPMVQAAGGRVVLEVQERLIQISAELPDLADIVSFGNPLPPFDWHCPLLSLPLAFGTTLETIPTQTPYLSIPEQARKKMDALQWPSEGLCIGLVWAGKSTFLKDSARFRSIPFSLLKPLLDQNGVHFFSLQIGEAASQLAGVQETITDLSPYVSDMADTAAQIAHLDLVITVDTSVAHLAGALGVKTWVLLPFAADWRWLRARRDSPWYPEMRLFRQPKPGDWDAVIDEVLDALRAIFPTW